MFARFLLYLDVSNLWIDFVFGVNRSWIFIKIPAVFKNVFSAIVIFIVEFISGFILDQLTGSCPWEYKYGYHVMGYIQLEYLPAWMLFVFMIEKIYTFLDKAFEVQNT